MTADATLKLVVHVTPAVAAEKAGPPPVPTCTSPALGTTSQPAEADPLVHAARTQLLRAIRSRHHHDKSARQTKQPETTTAGQKLSRCRKNLLSEIARFNSCTRRLRPPCSNSGPPPPPPLPDHLPQTTSLSGSSPSAPQAAADTFQLLRREIVAFRHSKLRSVRKDVAGKRRWQLPVPERATFSNWAARFPTNTRTVCEVVPEYIIYVCVLVVYSCICVT